MQNRSKKRTAAVPQTAESVAVYLLSSHSFSVSRCFDERVFFPAICNMKDLETYGTKMFHGFFRSPEANVFESVMELNNNLIYT
jgi:hypothetical protein